MRVRERGRERRREQGRERRRGRGRKRRCVARVHCSRGGVQLADGEGRILKLARVARRAIQPAEIGSGPERGDQRKLAHRRADLVQRPTGYATPLRVAADGTVEDDDATALSAALLTQRDGEFAGLIGRRVNCEGLRRVNTVALPHAQAVQALAGGWRLRPTRSGKAPILVACLHASHTQSTRVHTPAHTSLSTYAVRGIYAYAGT